MRIALGILLLLCGACSQPNATGKAASAAEAKEYLKSLALSDFDMKGAESFGGQRLVEITGKITNKGQRTLRQVELSCVFTDPYGQEIFRDKVAIVRPDRDALKPSETKPYRLAFDTVPAAWNQAPPHMVMAGVVFE
jgi:hypothetical protein